MGYILGPGRLALPSSFFPTPQSNIHMLRQVIEEYDQGIQYSDADNSDRMLLFSGILDRDAVQRLIRAARRARDTQFGADE